jgi:hypothetical protein
LFKRTTIPAVGLSLLVTIAILPRLAAADHDANPHYCGDPNLKTGVRACIDQMAPPQMYPVSEAGFIRDRKHTELTDSDIADLGFQLKRSLDAQPAAICELRFYDKGVVTLCEAPSPAAAFGSDSRGVRRMPN